MVSVLGIKQPRVHKSNCVNDSLNAVPYLDVTGTFPIMKDEFTCEESNLDKLRKSNRGIILHPQPTDDHKDPLNWPLWRRDLALIVVGWHCFVGGGQTSILAAGMEILANEFQTSLTKISYMIGSSMLALAFGAIISSPIASLFGKRLVYLGGIVIFLMGSIGSAASTDYTSLLTSRIITGIGVSTIESLPSATIAEIFFAHERAYRFGIYTLLLLGGKNLVPLFGALAFQKLNRQWLFWIVTIIVGLNLILHLFFVPETFWDRTPTPNVRSLKESEIARSVGYHNHIHPLDINSFSLSNTNNSVSSSNSQEPTEYKYKSGDGSCKPGYFSRIYSALSQSKLTSGLGLYHGRHTMDRWYMIIVRPFVLLSYPAVLFGSLLYSFAVIWLIMISQLIEHSFSKSPYNFHPVSIGLLYISPFIGGCIGSLCAGHISDFFVRLMSRLNHGIYEPEFRLIMVFPAVVSTTIGLMGFGWSVERGDMWFIPTLFFGIIGFGSSLASTTSITFAIDSYK